MSRLLDMWAGMTGTVLDFAGSTAPNGWLLCYGQSLLRTDYPNLFAKIGTTYGAVDGTHFNLPDCRGRVLAGKDDMGGTAASRLTSAVSGSTLGASGGTETHTLTASQIPSITSSVSASLSSGNLVQSNGGTSSYSTGTGGGTIWQAFANGSTQSLVSPTASGSASSNNTGGGAHSNTQPTIVFNKIIKT